MGEETLTATCGGCGKPFDDPAAIAATPADERQPCPDCGSHAVNYRRTFHAVTSTTVDMTAHLRGGSSAREGVRIQRGGGLRSAAADYDAGGLVDQVRHPASRKEISELRTAARLVERLNRERDNWQAAEARTGMEDGVDCIARGKDGETLRIQVTTPEREIWARLARNPDGEERREPTMDAAIEALRRTIDAKSKFAGKDQIVLALDATDSPRYALQAVVDAFRARHGVQAQTVGYREIWVVGPAVDLVHRLDRPSSVNARGSN